EFLGEYAPLTYRLATFAPDGKLIDKAEVSGRSSLSQDIRLATIHSSMEIDVEVLTAEYEKDPEKEGYWDNKIVRTTSVGKEKYKVSAAGKIELISNTRTDTLNVMASEGN